MSRSYSFDALELEMKRRLELLQELLKAAEKTGHVELKELAQVLANGLTITTQEAVKLLRPLREVMAAGGVEEKEERVVAAKSEAAGPIRDRQGRKIVKPHGLSPEHEEPQGPRRDSQGRRINKPNATRRAGWGR